MDQHVLLTLFVLRIFLILLLTSTRLGLASHQVVHLGTQDAQTNQNENSEGAQHYDRVKVK